MLSHLRLVQTRCFNVIELELDVTGLTVFTGANAQGKTSLLEAVCVLLRLQSPRTMGLGELVQVGQDAAAIEGDYAGKRLRVVLGSGRKMLVDGKVVGRSCDYFRESGLVVWMGNDDIQLVRGAADGRRRFLDFAASQLFPDYLESLRAYDRALRARNFLLKSGEIENRQLHAYAKILVQHGAIVTAGRRALVDALSVHANLAQHEMSDSTEMLSLSYEDASPGGLEVALAESAAEEKRRRSTVVGPHRDDLGLVLNGRSATAFASEGQQRTVALALKVAQARVLAVARSCWPILLLDDIFGELDPKRRHRLFSALPQEAQKLVTTTSLAWLEQEHPKDLRVLRLHQGRLEHL